MRCSRHNISVPSQLSLQVKGFDFMRAEPTLGAPSRKASFSDLWLITATTDVQGTPSAWGLFIWTRSAAASDASSLISQQAEAGSRAGGVGTSPFLTAQQSQTCPMVTDQGSSCQLLMNEFSLLLFDTWPLMCVRLWCPHRATGKAVREKFQWLFKLCQTKKKCITGNVKH